MSSTNYPLLMTEEYWANTQLSVVRYDGSADMVAKTAVKYADALIKELNKD